ARPADRGVVRRGEVARVERVPPPGTPLGDRAISARVLDDRGVIADARFLTVRRPMAGGWPLRGCGRSAVAPANHAMGSSPAQRHNPLLVSPFPRGEGGWGVRVRVRRLPLSCATILEARPS